MKIPEQTLKYINLQRTKMPDTNVFIAEIKREFDEIKSFLPVRCKNVLDIGCGVCAIDFFLNEHYENNIRFNLVDKDQVDKNIHYGYKANGSFYNSFQAASELLEANDIKTFNFITGEKGNDIPNIGQQDIIISLLSCGYHYPVSFYLDKANELLSKKGVFILDVRENTDGIEKLKEVFSSVEIIRNENKAFRVCASRKFEKVEDK